MKEHKKIQGAGMSVASALDALASAAVAVDGTPKAGVTNGEHKKDEDKKENAW